ncbi:MAG TPA: hypothetical protein VHI30_05210 [Gaiellales bacterium]|jgi:hypothetical protein|nr:hypothetical protein [Gaiellales bacterium]
MFGPDHDALVMVASIVLAMAGMFAGLAASGPRRVAWIQVSLLFGVAALVLVATLWALGLSEPNHGGGMECSVNPQHGYLGALVLSVAMAVAAGAAAVKAPALMYARGVAVGASATAVVVLVGSLVYVTAANPAC